MSWHFAPGLAVSPLDSNELVSEPSAMSSGTPTVLPYSPHACETDGLTVPPYGTTLPHSTGDRGVDAWVFSLPVFPASPSPWPEGGEDQQTHATCGPTSSASFAKYDHLISSWRTFQACLWQSPDGSPHYQPFLGTWPGGGMMHSGLCYRLPPLALPTNANASSLLPTPTKSDGIASSFTTYQGAAACILSGKHQKRWFYYRIVYSNLKKGWVNPRFAEMMMGLPIGWSDLQPLERPLSPLSRSPLDTALLPV